MQFRTGWTYVLSIWICVAGCSATSQPLEYELISEEYPHLTIRSTPITTPYPTSIPIDPIHEGTRWVEEQSVMKTALEYRCGTENPLYVLHATTGFSWRERDQQLALVRDARDENSNIPTPTPEPPPPPEFQDLYAMNSQTYLLPSSLDLGRPLHLLTPDELSGLTDPTLPKNEQVMQIAERFHELYPTDCGIVTLSRVGFNEDRTEAIIVIYQKYLPGFLIEHGINLEKQGDKWQVQKEYMTRIS